MRALLSKEVGGPDMLVVEEVDDPSAGQGEVVIDVKACGVNYPDVLIIQDLYQFKPGRPFSPGGEVAGVVAEVGEEVEHLRPGDRVIAINTFGGMATKFKASAAQCIPMPEQMSFEHGATFLMTYATSYYALKDRAMLEEGETLLVLGASGGVGVAAIEIAKALGARVVAATSSQQKVDFAQEAGADEGLVYPRGELDKAASKELARALKKACGGEGADVIYDPVGGALAEPALRAMGWGGRYLVIGFTAGIPKIPLNLTLLKSCSIVGVFWGAHTMREPELHRQNIKGLMKLYAEGRVAPRISARYGLDEAATAIEDLAERRARGKIVITTDEE